MIRNSAAGKRLENKAEFLVSSYSTIKNSNAVIEYFNQLRWTALFTTIGITYRLWNATTEHQIYRCWYGRQHSTNEHGKLDPEFFNLYERLRSSLIFLLRIGSPALVADETLAPIKDRMMFVAGKTAHWWCTASRAGAKQTADSRCQQRWRHVLARYQGACLAWCCVKSQHTSWNPQCHRTCVLWRRSLSTTIAASK